MSKSQRDKGKVFEREIVNLAKAAGLDAKRTAPLQAGYGSSDDSDVLVAGLRCECKHWAVIPQWKKLLAAHDSDTPAKLGKVLRSMLHGHNVLILKQTRCGTLVVDAGHNVWDWAEWLKHVCMAGPTKAAHHWPVYQSELHEAMRPAHNNPGTPNNEATGESND